MQKKTKRIIIISILVALFVILLFLILKNKTNKISQIQQDTAKATIYTNIGEQEIDITNLVEENPTPKVAVGMIPIKRIEDNWVITTVDDNTWYNYASGEPAYIMLNDGVYQTEEYYQMPNSKKLVENNIGTEISINDISTLGTIYVWMPRFAYNNNEIVYLKEECMISGKYTMPDLFTYELGERQVSLSGVWLQYDSTDASTLSDATQREKANRNILETKLQGLNAGKEDTTYGFLAYTKASIVLVEVEDASNPKDIKMVTDIDSTNARIDAISSFTREMNELQGENETTSTILKKEDNANRTVLNVIDKDKTEPFLAKDATAVYDPNGGDAGQIRVEISYSKNGIAKIIDENGKELNYPNGENDKTVGLTADDELLGNGIYYYYIIDIYGNMVKARCEVTGSSIYMIKDRETLILFRDAVNGGQSDAIGYQIADVTDLNEGKYTVDSTTGLPTFTSTAEVWTPIGSAKAKPFTGKYYGNNHTISGIYINENSGSYQGFIGYGSGTIKDLTINDTSIKTTGNNLGGFIGNAVGNTTIENCIFEGLVEGTSTTSKHLGGFIGYCSNSEIEIVITNCKTKGKIRAYYNNAGGVCGNISCKSLNINNCENNAKIFCDGNMTSGRAGGIIGQVDVLTLNVINCNNKANVSTSVSGGSYGDGGGIIGYINGGFNTATIKKCYNVAQVDGGGKIGGIIGYINGSGGVSSNLNICECYNIGTISSDGDKAGGIVGQNNSSTTDSSINIMDCYNIGEITGLKNIGGIAGYAGAANIQYCYNIGNVTSTGNQVGGITGYISYGSVGSKLEYVYNIGNITGANSTGGIVGYMYGYNKPASYVNYAYNTGNVTGVENVGGIAGQLGISNGNSSYVNYIYNTGSVSGKKYVGGIVGASAGSNITYVYNCGDINATSTYSGGIVGSSDATVSYAYNANKITGYTYMGGIAGGALKLTNVYNLGEINTTKASSPYIGGISLGRTSAATNATITRAYNAGNVTGAKNYYGAISCYGTLSNCGFLDGTAPHAIGGSSATAGSDTGATRYTSAASMPTVSSIVGTTYFSSTNFREFNGFQIPKLIWETDNDRLNLLNLNKTDTDTLFVEDTNNINNGYPILAWQAE